MFVSDFSFDLPESQIAQAPAPRGLARLLVVRRSTQSWEVATTGQLARFLDRGDLVANDTRVFPARLLGRRDPSGGAVECLLLSPEPDGTWQALVHPGQKLKPGARIVLEDEARAPGVRVRAEVLGRQYFGRRLLRVEVEGAEGAASLDAAVDAIGHVPLPPYIHRPDTAADRDQYQTVFARARGSVAAPTAGLHFDAATLSSLSAAGIGWATITLHVGYGTFKPVRAARVEDHAVDPERFEISDATAAAIHDTRAAGRRVVAVGTTTVRALETAAARDGRVRAGSGETSLFIHPGHRFAAVDALVTNFHLPCSSLLMLVAAFAGTDLTLAAYRHAVRTGFRFYSYGDAMLIV